MIPDYVSDIATKFSEIIEEQPEDMSMIAGQVNSLQLTMHQHRKRRSALQGRKIHLANET